MEPQKFTNFGLQLSLGVKDWLKVYVYRCFFSPQLLVAFRTSLQPKMCTWGLHDQMDGPQFS